AITKHEVRLEHAEQLRVLRGRKPGVHEERQMPATHRAEPPRDGLERRGPDDGDTQRAANAGARIELRGDTFGQRLQTRVAQLAPRRARPGWPDLDQRGVRAAAGAHVAVDHQIDTSDLTGAHSATASANGRAGALPNPAG